MSPAIFLAIPASCFGVFAMPVREEFGLGVAMVLTFVGMVLHWQLPRQRMVAEEQVKDGKLTEMQAKRRLKWLGIAATTSTLLGVVLLLGVVAAFAD